MSTRVSFDFFFFILRTEATKVPLGLINSISMEVPWLKRVGEEFYLKPMARVLLQTQDPYY